MRNSFWLLLLLVACCTAADAQNITGTVNGAADDIHVFSVDFGAVAQPVTFNLAISAPTGTSGLDVNLFDLDGILLSNPTSVDSGNDSGNGTINLSITTPSFSGVRDLSISVQTFSGTGSSTYSGTLSTAATLGAGGLGTGQLQTIPASDGIFFVFGRALVYRATFNGAVTFSQGFQIDFGTTAHTVSFFANGNGSGLSNAQIFEVPSSANLLATLNATAGAMNDVTTSATSGSYAGAVNFRIDTTSTATGTIEIVMIFEDTVTVQAEPIFGGTTHSRSSDCSTAGIPGQNWLVLLGVLAGLAVATRLRGSRE